MVHLFTSNTYTNGTNFYTKIPIITLIFICVIVYFMIIISSKISLRSFKKLSPIEAIHNNKVIKSSRKQLKASKIIDKLFGEEGIIAYKNIRRDKIKYQTITLSLTVSIVLFLGLSSLASNFYKSNFYGDLLIQADMSSNTFGNCSIICHRTKENQKDIYKLIDYLEKNSMITAHCIYSLESNVSNKVKLTENNISNQVQKLAYEGKFNNGTEGEIYINTQTICYYDEAYNFILKKAGISELNDNEIILMDTAYDNLKSEKKIRLTNYEVGNNYTIEKDGKAKTFKIVGILEDFAPYTVYESRNSVLNVSSPIIIQMVNQNNIERENDVYISLIANDTYEIEKNTDKLSNIIEGIVRFQNVGNIIKSLETQKFITDIVIISFISLLAIVSAINIYNTIYSSILLRKRDFAVLKSIGMSEKQNTKMMFLSGIFYGLDSCIYGITISIVILSITYLNMGINRSIYPLEIPWFNIALCIFTVYLIIFVSMRSAKRKLVNKNIIDEIKNENL